MLQVHADYDTRHDHPALVAFPPSAQRYWNAFATGTAVPLATLGIQPPDGWIFQAAFAIRLPGESAHQAAAELRTKSLELRTRSGSSFLSS